MGWTADPSAQDVSTPVEAGTASRSSDRLAPDRPQPVQEPADGALLGYLANLSLAGLKLRAGMALPMHQSRHLRLSYTEIDGQALSVVVHVEGIWARRTEHPDTPHEMGFRFVTLPRDVRIGVQRIMDDLARRRRSAVGPDT